MRDDLVRVAQYASLSFGRARSPQTSTLVSLTISFTVPPVCGVLSIVDKNLHFPHIDFAHNRNRLNDLAEESGLRLRRQ